MYNTYRRFSKTAPVTRVGPYRFINQMNANYTTTVFKIHNNISINNFVRPTACAQDIRIFNIIIIYRNLRAHGCWMCAIDRLINICLARADRTHCNIHKYIRIRWPDLQLALLRCILLLFSSSPSHAAVAAVSLYVSF